MNPTVVEPCALAAAWTPMVSRTPEDAIMRFITAALVLTLAACSPQAPAAPSTSSVSAASSPAPAASAQPALDASALQGQWSFDRTCGVYDLVLNAGNEALYFDYADPSQVVSYAGRWAIAGNRIVLTVNKSGEEGSQLGETVTYNLDVSAPVTDDLMGSFGRANGETRSINAKRCPQEDRE
jgi:hypothetical protein